MSKVGSKHVSTLTNFQVVGNMVQLLCRLVLLHGARLEMKKKIRQERKQ